MWKSAYNLQGIYETPSACPKTIAPDRAKAEQMIRSRARIGPHHSDRSRIEAIAGGLWHCRSSKRASRAPKIEAVKAADDIRLSGRAEDLFGNHHAQDRCRRRAVEPEERRCRAHRLSTHRKRRAREGGHRALPGRHRAADDQTRRLRDHHRRQHRSAVRAGAVVRFGRSAGGSVQRSRAGAAAAQLDAGPPHDGTDDDLQSAEGCARPPAGRSGCAGDS